MTFYINRFINERIASTGRRWSNLVILFLTKQRQVRVEEPQPQERPVLQWNHGEAWKLCDVCNALHLKHLSSSLCFKECQDTDGNVNYWAFHEIFLFEVAFSFAYSLLSEGTKEAPCHWFLLGVYWMPGHSYIERFKRTSHDRVRCSAAVPFICFLAETWAKGAARCSRGSSPPTEAPCAKKSAVPRDLQP